ncbi:Transcription factor atf1 [Ceratocystis fimbriata CBS 114723]|uniref:Transcription factor atf1 n=1 Tax=Ceratocystis fimbriata CBS 114723 TaxID=1035309 RepID=A0A2C5XA46_9PEZI|nr:Transcription factor atf1 [Ceratocystis fimbriata CBS 114723]
MTSTIDSSSDSLNRRASDAIPIKQEGGRPINEALKNELNPFEKSFSGGGTAPTNGAQTPGAATKLPSVSALASPSAGLGNGSPFGWNNSLKSGPLSPALLTGPLANSGATDYFVERGFNESSLRTGLTPGPGGAGAAMFPPSPNTSALFSSFAAGASTPTTADFHRTALSAATKQREQQQKMHMAVTSEPRDANGATVAPSTDKGDMKPPASNLNNDPHANDAVNGLFMLAQGRNVPPSGSQFPMTSQSQPQSNSNMAMAHPPMTVSNTRPPATNAPAPNSGSAPQAAPASGPVSISQMAASAPAPSAPAIPVAPKPLPDAPQHTSPDLRNSKISMVGKGKRGPAPTKPGAVNGKRKNDSPPAPINKKTKNASSQASDDDDEEVGEDGKKMTDDEKRKNFLERNRIAALKCRQRKKQWLTELQSRVDSLTNENDDLNLQIGRLRTEMVNLKTLLLAHKDCPVTMEQVVRGQYPTDTSDNFNAQMNPYPAGGVPNGVQGQPHRMTTGQPILNGQNSGRGFQ